MVVGMYVRGGRGQRPQGYEFGKLSGPSSYEKFVNTPLLQYQTVAPTKVRIRDFSILLDV